MAEKKSKGKTEYVRGNPMNRDKKPQWDEGWSILIP